MTSGDGLLSTGIQALQNIVTPIPPPAEGLVLTSNEAEPPTYQAGGGGGAVSVTDAGSGNIVVTPSPGTGVFTLDVGAGLSNVNIIVSEAGVNLTLLVPYFADADGAAIHATGGNGGNNSLADGNGYAGGNVILEGGLGGNATAGNADGGVGGSIDLQPRSGGNEIGTGAPGAYGSVMVNSTPIFDYQATPLFNMPGGVSGSFTTVDGKTVTVTNGIITAIV